MRWTLSRRQKEYNFAYWRKGESWSNGKRICSIKPEESKAAIVWKLYLYVTHPTRIDCCSSRLHSYGLTFANVGPSLDRLWPHRLDEGYRLWSPALHVHYFHAGFALHRTWFGAIQSHYLREPDLLGSLLFVNRSSLPWTKPCLDAGRAWRRWNSIERYGHSSYAWNDASL